MRRFKGDVTGWIVLIAIVLAVTLLITGAGSLIGAVSRSGDTSGDQTTPHRD